MGRAPRPFPTYPSATYPRSVMIGPKPAFTVDLTCMASFLRVGGGFIAGAGFPH